MTISLQLAEALAASIPDTQPGLFNPYRSRCAFDTEENGPRQRLLRLAMHLDCDPKFVLLGEAPGYQGCRYSGMTFTSERLLMEGAIPRLPRVTHRLSTRKLPFSEPSATIVWKALREIGIENDTILWNALQMHPHPVDNPWKNRTPKPAELKQGAKAVSLLKEAYPKATFVAVGQKARELLTDMGLEVAAVVRHPANGGATLFTDGMKRLCASAHGR